MIVTEEEAKTKRCQESFGDTNVSPLGHSYAATAVSPYSGASASVAVNTSPMMCIGSACMAWRWDYTVSKSGYCGKAGRP